MTKYDQIGFKRAEQFIVQGCRTARRRSTGRLASRRTSIHQEIRRSFRLWGPVIRSNVPAENFVGPNATTEYGFLSVLSELSRPDKILHITPEDRTVRGHKRQVLLRRFEVEWKLHVSVRVLQVAAMAPRPS